MDPPLIGQVMTSLPFRLDFNSPNLNPESISFLSDLESSEKKSLMMIKPHV